MIDTRCSLLALSALTVTVGCSGDFDGPTVDAFRGQLVSEGQPVSFAADENVKLVLIHKGSSDRFNIPIKADGTFEIGWMPIGEYLGSLDLKQGEAAKPWEFQSTFKAIPTGFRIEEGKTEYEIEIGKI